KALDSAINLLEKRYGKGAIMNLANKPVEEIAAIPTGSLGLDIALGIGGLPKGRICEIYGPESSGKTTLALHLAAEAQKQGGTVVFIDAEHALDVQYAKKLGVDTGKLLVSQPDCGEQALEICETLIQSGSVDFVVIDSVAALVPRAEIDGEMGDQQPGLQARLMSKALRKLTGVTARSGASILFINQIRHKIGVMFGSPETTAGGNALKFYCSVRLDIRRVGSIKDNADVTGNRTRVKVVKNKVAAPFKQAEFDIIFNEGISQNGELVDIGVEKGIIDKAGAWYSYKGERLGQGREGAKIFLKENPEAAAEIRNLILETMGIDSLAPSKSSSEDNIELNSSTAKGEKIDKTQEKENLKNSDGEKNSKKTAKESPIKAADSKVTNIDSKKKAVNQ
ncbi:MAG: recombinase RecA, partial [Bdellovibrionales bacterium]|nr:recombinase RecA [Bdellovibrionales bacterium]